MNRTKDGVVDILMLTSQDLDHCLEFALVLGSILFAHLTRAGSTLNSLDSSPANVRLDLVNVPVIWMRIVDTSPTKSMDIYRVTRTLGHVVDLSECIPKSHITKFLNMFVGQVYLQNLLSNRFVMALSTFPLSITNVISV